MQTDNVASVAASLFQTGAKEHLAGDKVKHEVFAHPLPFNVIPQIDAFQENGYTKEEMLLCGSSSWPLHQKYTLKKVIMSTYQAASGAGAEGMDELVEFLRPFPHLGDFIAAPHEQRRLPLTYELPKSTQTSVDM